MIIITVSNTRSKQQGLMTLIRLALLHCINHVIDFGKLTLKVVKALDWQSVGHQE
jgi:hypothetical protein